jgi:peptidase E
MSAMTTREPTIVALGGGGFSNDPDDEAGRRLDQLVIDATGRERPKICWIGTASGDAESYTLKFYRGFPDRADPTDLNLFYKARHPGLREFILGLDAVYVGGGSTLNLLAIWRSHGLDAILADAWRAGVILAGISAGMICWFEQAVSDSFHDGTLRPLDGLGLLPGSACSHFNEPARRADYPELVRNGVSAGYAADDHVALIFRGTDFVEAVSCSATAGAYRVEPDGLTALEVRRI